MKYSLGKLMFKRKKILILGVGNLQVDPIRILKDGNHEVHALSYKDEGPGRAFVDKFDVVDIVDKESVKKYVLENNIEVLYSIGSDIAMPTISYVSEVLDLPHFVSFKTANTCQNKWQLRSYIGDDFNGNIPFRRIKSINDIQYWKNYPCVLKPVDSQGQRGVFVLDSIADFYQYFEKSLKYSKSNELIVENFINGPELSINVYVVDGTIVFIQTTDRLVFKNYPGGLVKEHRIPSVFISNEMELKILDLVKFVVNKLQILNGPVYFQIKIIDNSPKLIEVTPRLDGCHIWRLIKEYCGVNLLEITFKHLIDNTLDLESFKKNELNPYKLTFLNEKPGKNVNRNKYQVKNPIYLEWYYNQDEIVRPINNYFEKIGYYIKEC
ncbi:MAG: ATP-grasp domain-containing protein [Bacteroidales bacterium]|nr:ATP-grasp domain-containing protein [Bacteroidales bacterium]